MILQYIDLYIDLVWATSLWAETRRSHPTLCNFSGKYSSYRPGVNVCFAVKKRCRGVMIITISLYPQCSSTTWLVTDWSYMLPCLSEDEEEVEGDGEGAFGKTLSVGVMPGLPRPEELELLERCGP